MRRAALLIASDAGATATLTAIRPDGQIVALSPGAQWGLDVARVVAGEIGIDLITLTSGPDGKHSRASLHNGGNAFDLRSHGRRPGGMKVAQRREFLSRLKVVLGPDYDAILELGRAPHFHIEYQPKGPGLMVTQNDLDARP